MNNSSVTTGSIVLSATSLEPVVSWFLHGRPDPIPETVPLFIAAAVLTIGHAVYNWLKIKGYLPNDNSNPSNAGSSDKSA